MQSDAVAYVIVKRAYKQREDFIMYMVYYTNGDIVNFSIIDDLNADNVITGTDRKEFLHTIAERYKVKFIECID